MSNPIIVEILSSRVQYNLKLIEYIFSMILLIVNLYIVHIFVFLCWSANIWHLTAEQTLHLPLIQICVLGVSKNQSSSSDGTGDKQTNVGLCHLTFSVTSCHVSDPVPGLVTVEVSSTHSGASYWGQAHASSPPSHAALGTHLLYWSFVTGMVLLETNKFSGNTNRWHPCPPLIVITSAWTPLEKSSAVVTSHTRRRARMRLGK